MHSESRSAEAEPGSGCGGRAAVTVTVTVMLKAATTRKPPAGAAPALSGNGDGCGGAAPTAGVKVGGVLHSPRLAGPRRPSESPARASRQTRTRMPVGIRAWSSTVQLVRPAAPVDASR